MISYRWGGVGWDNNVHVPVQTQAQQPHHRSLKHTQAPTRRTHTHYQHLRYGYKILHRTKRNSRISTLHLYVIVMMMMLMLMLRLMLLMMLMLMLMLLMMMMMVMMAVMVMVMVMTMMTTTKKKHDNDGDGDGGDDDDWP